MSFGAFVPRELLVTGGVGDIWKRVRRRAGRQPPARPSLLVHYALISVSAGGPCGSVHALLERRSRTRRGRLAFFAASGLPVRSARPVTRTGARGRLLKGRLLVLQANHSHDCPEVQRRHQHHPRQRIFPGYDVPGMGKDGGTASGTFVALSSIARRSLSSPSRSTLAAVLMVTFFGLNAMVSRCRRPPASGCTAHRTAAVKFWLPPVPTAIKSKISRMQ